MAAQLSFSKILWIRRRVGGLHGIGLVSVPRALADATARRRKEASRYLTTGATSKVAARAPGGARRIHQRRIPDHILHSECDLFSASQRLEFRASAEQCGESSVVIPELKRARIANDRRSATGSGDPQSVGSTGSQTISTRTVGRRPRLNNSATAEAPRRHVGQVGERSTTSASVPRRPKLAQEIRFIEFRQPCRQPRRPGSRPASNVAVNCGAISVAPTVTAENQRRTSAAGGGGTRSGRKDTSARTQESGMPPRGQAATGEAAVKRSPLPPSRPPSTGRRAEDSN